LTPQSGDDLVNPGDGQPVVELAGGIGLAVPEEKTVITGNDELLDPPDQTNQFLEPVGAGVGLGGGLLLDLPLFVADGFEGLLNGHLAGTDGVAVLSDLFGILGPLLGGGVLLTLPLQALLKLLVSKGEGEGAGFYLCGEVGGVGNECLRLLDGVLADLEDFGNDLPRFLSALSRRKVLSSLPLLRLGLKVSQHRPFRRHDGPLRRRQVSALDVQANDKGESAIVVAVVIGEGRFNSGLLAGGKTISPIKDQPLIAGQRLPEPVGGDVRRQGIQFRRRHHREQVGVGVCLHPFGSYRLCFFVPAQVEYDGA
jgi:hypothetical protein